MVEIPDSLYLLFTGELEQQDDQYVIEVPNEAFNASESPVQSDRQYRIAIINTPESIDKSRESTTDHSESESTTESQSPQGPPVETGDVRTVTIEALGDQGDGIAKVERGYVLIVPGGEPGDELTVRVEDVRENVGFAQMVNGQI
jgi:predicted RNA-binding protein with TRAM domain